MVRSKILAGNCNMATQVTCSLQADGLVKTLIESDCPHITKLAARLQLLDPMKEISFDQKQGNSRVQQTMQEECPHPSCIVFSGILRTMEAAAGLALTTDMSVTFETTQD
ncbi:MAG: DUF6951 family protein [Spirochaetota bacterium]